MEVDSTNVWVDQTAHDCKRGLEGRVGGRRFELFLRNFCLPVKQASLCRKLLKKARR